MRLFARQFAQRVVSGRGLCSRNGRSGNRCLAFFPWLRIARCNISRMSFGNCSSDARTYWLFLLAWQFPPSANDDLYDSEVTWVLLKKFVGRKIKQRLSFS